jgi:DNA polymerase-3 subunit gamma/tau
MTYQVLARKWRPRDFGAVVGQEHVVRALANALDNGRLHHAYLFSGTRGVGKTTLARILAKCLNCEAGVSARPCGQCSPCREIDEGRFVDLIEVDAASRTKVEDTRELLENVPYAPSRGRYKVYLIDEVHMLSTHSFNALLKTLEEPPPHVKFLLATTDPQKLPMTVLSRCLQFSLKRLSPERISAQLGHILTEEGVEFEPGGLQELARAAEGSMRDALSLLDQAIAHGQGAVREQEVRAMLGTLDRGDALRLAQALGDGDARGVLEWVAEISEQGIDYAEVLVELLRLLQRLALAQWVPGVLEDAQEQAALKALASKLSPEEVQLFYQIALMGHRDIGVAPEPRGALEMTLLRMLAFRPVTVEAAPPVDPSRAVREPAPTAGPTRVAAAESPRGERPEPHSEDWGTLVAALKLTGLVRELATHSVLKERTGDTFRLVVDTAHAHLVSKRLESRLGDSLAQHLGMPVRLVVEQGMPQGQTPAQRAEQERSERQRAAVEAIESDPQVQSLRDTFNASLRLDSVRPADDDSHP